MSIVSLLRQAYFLVAFNFYAKPKINRVDRISMFGFSLDVPPTIFHPGLYFSSKFLGEYLQTLELQNRRVLDVGCGSGILSLVAGSRGASVTGVDINPVAIQATINNAERNSLQSSITGRVSDLFDSLDDNDQYDIILLNPPFYLG